MKLGEGTNGMSKLCSSTSFVQHNQIVMIPVTSTSVIQDDSMDMYDNLVYGIN